MGEQTDDRAELRADCARCEGLCCVAPAFAKSADFAFDKPAGHPCRHLSADSRCGIHAQLRSSGFPGCTVFDCFGAGQQVVQVTYAGRSWREDPTVASSIFDVFHGMRQAKESLWYLAEAAAVLPAGDLREAVEQLQQRTRGLIDAEPAVLAAWDAAAHRSDIGALLGAVSEAVRSGSPGRGRDRAGEDLMGAKLRGADLRAISLRGAYLIGADLRGADLTKTDLLGADLRGADVRGTRMAASLFLTQPQVSAARGDGTTTLPAWLARPDHWR